MRLFTYIAGNMGCSHMRIDLIDVVHFGLRNSDVRNDFGLDFLGISFRIQRN